MDFKTESGFEPRFFFPIPSKPVVRYSNGHIGGPLEEAFSPEEFIDACFSEGIVDDELVSARAELEKAFVVTAPWYPQVARFCRDRGQKRFTCRKVDASVRLAEQCSTIPKTFTQLAARLLETREEHPLRHPYDVQLSRVRGLTSMALA